MIAADPGRPAAPPPVVLLHGVQSGPSTFWRVAPALRRLGFEVVTPALPGHAGRPALAQHVTDGVARAIAPEVPHGALVVGHSLGAVVALRLAAFRTDLVGLVLEDPPGAAGIAPIELAGDVVAESRRAREDPEGEVALTLAAEPRWEPEDARSAVANRAALDDAAADRLLREDRWDLVALMRPLRLPITLIAASEPGTALTGAERSAVIEAATATVEPESGHGVHRDRPDDWVAAVAQAAGSPLPPASATQSA